MTRKIHLRRNKVVPGKSAIASCAARSSGAGKCVNNSRSTYRFMASAIVGFDEFLATPVDDRCAHCMDTGLVWINRQAREKGREPFAGWAEFAAYRAARKTA